MARKAAVAAQKTRIQSENEALILDAALEVFSAFGYRGATVDQIAARSGLSKPNLLYYFRSKDEIYKAVLERTLALWLTPLQALDPSKDPVEELTRYITAKLDMSFANPQASRLFANEILHGAPKIEGFLKGPLKLLVDGKAEVINGWVKEGKLAPIDPYHFIFAIWAVTQHYADFAVQVEAVIGRKPAPDSVQRAVCQILLQGIARGTKT
jgi:TetR/AcrR family transcriptional regulator